MSTIIDLTLDDDIPNPLSSQFLEQSAVKHPKKEFVREEEEKLKVEVKIVSQYEWVYLENTDNELDYIKSFQDRHRQDRIDYQTLNIETLDPNYVEPNSFRGNVIDKILKSLAKDGVLKEKKKIQDDYDKDDTFVDDSDPFNSNMATLNQLTPAFDDFICMAGNIEQFKRSNYFDTRLKIAKKHNHEVRKSKGKNEGKIGKKSGKETKKRSDPEGRPSEDLKKVKTLSTPKMTKQTELIIQS